jgi:hypothetical protein
VDRKTVYRVLLEWVFAAFIEKDLKHKSYLVNLEPEGIKVSQNAKMAQTKAKWIDELGKCCIIASD